MIQWLKKVDNGALRSIKVLIDSNLEGYITEFVVDIVKSYSDVERKFFQGPRGRILLSLQLWIKMLIFEKGILKMKYGE